MAIYACAKAVTIEVVTILTTTAWLAIRILLTTEA